MVCPAVISAVIPSLDINPTPEVLDHEEQGPSNPFEQCGEEPFEPSEGLAFEELADVESAVGLL